MKEMYEEVEAIGHRIETTVLESVLNVYEGRGRADVRAAVHRIRNSVDEFRAFYFKYLLPEFSDLTNEQKPSILDMYSIFEDGITLTLDGLEIDWEEAGGYTEKEFMPAALTVLSNAAMLRMTIKDFFENNG
jgi:hypothetical protein